MTRGGQYAQVWVKVAIGSGILLGALLLIQSIRTYLFVADKILRDQAAEEAERKEMALVQAAISAKIPDVHQFGPLVEELQLEAPKEIAWIRILDIDGNVVAQAGTPITAAPKPDQLRHEIQMHQPHRVTVKSAAGDILVVDSRLRFLADRENGGRSGHADATQGRLFSRSPFISKV